MGTSVDGQAYKGPHSSCEILPCHAVTRAFRAFPKSRWQFKYYPVRSEFYSFQATTLKSISSAKEFRRLGLLVSYITARGDRELKMHVGQTGRTARRLKKLRSWQLYATSGILTAILLKIQVCAFPRRLHSPVWDTLPVIQIETVVSSLRQSTGNPHCDSFLQFEAIYR